jgi:rhodanese-related sulfurtransferase
VNDKKFLEERNLRDYNLVDVRTPKEYEQGHLPSAQLVPVGELTNRLSEKKEAKPSK